MEEREISVLLTLAEELHFGRTAQRLHISTAAVSQTVARLERRIGAALFTRTSRRVDLTDIGRRLVLELGPAHARIEAAMTAAVDAAHHIEIRLRVGYMSAAVGRELLTLVDSFPRLRPSCQVSIVETSLADLFGPLRRGEVNLSVLPLPMREEDLRVTTVLVRESAVVAVPRAHRLARRTHLHVNDLARESALEVAGPPDYWSEDRRVGRPPPPEREHITGFQELLTLVGAGRGVAVVGSQAADFYPRPDVSYVPLVDAMPFEYAAVVRKEDVSTTLADFIAHLGRAGT